MTGVAKKPLKQSVYSLFSLTCLVTQFEKEVYRVPCQAGNCCQQDAWEEKVNNAEMNIIVRY